LRWLPQASWAIPQVPGVSFRTALVPLPHALCDGSVQSCFGRSRHRESVGLRVLLTEFAGLLQQLPHLPLSADHSASPLPMLIFAAVATSTTWRKLTLSVAYLWFESSDHPSDTSPGVPAFRSERCHVTATLHAGRSKLFPGRHFVVSAHCCVTTSFCRADSASFASRAGIQGFEPWTSVPRGNGFHTVHHLAHLSWVFLGVATLLELRPAFQGLTGSTLQRISPPLPSRSCRTARADAGASRFLSIVLQLQKRLSASFPFRPQAFYPSAASSLPYLALSPWTLPLKAFLHCISKLPQPSGHR